MRPIAVFGPTASGKSALGLALAHELDGEVVNVDSMQLYRGMDIGTAKLTPADIDGVATAGISPVELAHYLGIKPTYADGTVGAVYGWKPPLVNASRKPGEWQSYDIIFERPRFASSRSLTQTVWPIL